MLDLCSKYRPNKFDQMYGNEHVASFLKSVINKPEDAPRYYGLFGPYGASKCVSEESCILVDNKVVPISSLFINKSLMKPGYYFDFSTEHLVHISGTTEPIYDGYYSGLSNTIELVPKYGLPIRATYQHRLLSYNQKTTWKYMTSFKAGDSILLDSTILDSGFIPDSFNRYFQLGVFWSLLKETKRVKETKYGTKFLLFPLVSYTWYTRIASFFEQNHICCSICPNSGLTFSDNDDFYFFYEQGLSFQELPKDISHFSFQEQAQFVSGFLYGYYLDKNKPTPIELPYAFLCFMGSVLRALGLWFSVDLVQRDQYIFSFLQRKEEQEFLLQILPFLEFEISCHSVPFGCFRDKTTGQFFYETTIKSIYKRSDHTYDLCNIHSHSFVSNGIISHNTTSARCFANEMKERYPTEYIEIDSGDKTIKDNFDKVRDIIFSEVPGWKVVCIDEAALLPPDTTQKLLKVLEDFHGKVFVFMATTEPQLLPDPLRSRLHEFFVKTMTTQQTIEYLKLIAEKESVSFSDKVYQAIALNSQGHYRNALKGLESVIFQGEEKFLADYSSIWVAIQEYFFNFDKVDDEIIRNLTPFHPVQLRPFMTNYFTDNIISSSSPYYNRVYPSAIVPKLFLQYLKYLSFVKDNDTFYAFLRVFRSTLRTIYERTHVTR